MAKINFLLLYCGELTTQLHQAWIVKTPIFHWHAQHRTELWVLGGLKSQKHLLKHSPRRDTCWCKLFKAYIVLYILDWCLSDCRHARLIMGKWAYLLRATLWLILLLQQRFYEGRPQLCLHARRGWWWGDTNRKSLTTNCPPRDQLSHRNQACLHKRLPPVFTASTHFCFTTSKLLGRLFCLTWTVSVRATLADESSWQTGGSSLMDTEGVTGSGRLSFHKHRNAQAWTFNKFFNNTGRLPRQKKAVAWGDTFKKRRELGTLLGRFPSVRQTKQAGSVLEAGAWITHCMLGKELSVVKHKKRKGSTSRERERKLADGVLLNPLKHPYIASTSSPTACKRRGM